MKKYYLICRGWVFSDVCVYDTLEELQHELDTLISLYDKDLDFQIVYGTQLFLGDYDD